MKVKTFLNKMMMSSTINTVRVEQYGYTRVEYDIADIRLADFEYGFWGSATVKTFRISGETLVINV